MSTGARAAGVKIGLEIHCQLTSLRTKLFCSCSSDYRSKDPNEMVCPVCFGLPGTLPVLNGKAVEYALRIANALGCKVPPETIFYRKNYFYPDLPKNFQISQYDKAGGIPIASGGSVRLEDKLVRIRRVQLEEDPGKLTYEGTIEKSTHSLVDYNRAGIALVEIVTEPDLNSAREAKLFLEKLRSTVEALGVSNGELEGAMRCDANVSVGGGARVEVKNISSFKEVEKALNYEILRQGSFSRAEERASVETRHWDERRSITISLRVKEEEQDYRYFPEPDLPSVLLSKEFLDRVRNGTPEVPEARAQRYMRDYHLSEQTARELTTDEALSKFFEETAKLSSNPTRVANWLLAEFGEDLRARLRGPNPPVRPQQVSELVSMVEDGSITRKRARGVFREMVTEGKSPSQLLASERGGVLKDEKGIGMLVEKVMREVPSSGEARESPKVFNYLVGQVLKQEPRADPRLVAKIIRGRLRR